MNKIVLSALAALTIGTISASAGDVKFYTDSNGQVFTTAGEGRTEVKMKQTSVFANADKLKFSGQAFVGYKATDYSNPATTNTQDFEIRRGYVQLKAYLLDDPKSYFRVTYDLKTNANTFDGQSAAVRAKYAYLNLNEVLPFTSLEMGLAHRPWHDYEEHNSWLYRSISEVLVENGNSAHLANSADMGVMAKTRTKYFDADIGVFNGEGYHAIQANNNGMSFEWRLTGHLLGTAGHPEKNTYLDASFFGQLNSKHNTTDSQGVALTKAEDLNFYGAHAVFNMPAFLASAQYISSDDTSSVSTHTSNGSGNGYSGNVEVRLGDDHQYKAFARYDHWTPKEIAGTKEYARITEIYGAAWKQNRNVEWVANVTLNNNEYASGAANPHSISSMLTAEINF